MPIPTYDFTDTLVLELVTRTHVPGELVTRYPGQPVDVKLVCMQDQEEWPCPSITQYRDWLAANTEPPTGTEG